MNNQPPANTLRESWHSYCRLVANVDDPEWRDAIRTAFWSGAHTTLHLITRESATDILPDDTELNDDNVDEAINSMLTQVRDLCAESQTFVQMQEMDAADELDPDDD